MEQAAEHLAQITGQRPQVTKAHVAVSGFRLREGNEIGCRVTLRGSGCSSSSTADLSVRPAAYPRLPRRNPKSFDGNGNYTLAWRSRSSSPKSTPDKVTFTQGMDVTFVTSTSNDDEARELLRSSACRSARRKERI